MSLLGKDGLFKWQLDISIYYSQKLHDIQMRYSQTVPEELRRLKIGQCEIQVGSGLGTTAQFSNSDSHKIANN